MPAPFAPPSARTSVQPSPLAWTGFILAAALIAATAAAPLLQLATRIVV